MSMSDPIADFLTRIRNGLAAKKRWVDVPSSALKKNRLLSQGTLHLQMHKNGHGGRYDGAPMNAT